VNLEFFTPQNDLLKRYIEGYYFISEKQAGQVAKYWTFPNNYCIVTANFQSSINFKENMISIVPSTAEHIYMSVVSRYKHPIKICYESPIHEITIYFKPLGINHFVGDPVKIFNQDHQTGTTAFDQDFAPAMQKIFTLKSREEQNVALEEYWLSKFMAKDLTFLAGLLMQIESGDKIEHIAERNNISRKHLNELMLKNLGKSAVEYRKIYRFRNVISNRKNIKKLTELTYENLFFDQSHLIRDFKALTNINPKSFFKEVDTGLPNVWRFI